MAENESRNIPFIGIAAGVLALGAVIGLSVLVGFFGPKPGFQWELASIFGTALGTTLLAVSTGALAWSTRSEVRATQRLAELTKHDQDVRQRPFVIQHDAVYSGSPDNGQLEVTLWNAGLGPALRVQVVATYEDADNPEIDAEIGTRTWPVLAPNSGTTFSLPVRFRNVPPGGVRGDCFPLRGSYLDSSQENEYEIITSWS